MKIKVESCTRYGMGNEYHEKYYYCPKCGKEILYNNGVVEIRGKKQKFCDNCGTELDWSDSGEKNKLNPQPLNGITFEVTSSRVIIRKKDDLHEKMLKQFERRETP